MSKFKEILKHIWSLIVRAFAFVEKGWKWMRTDGMLHCFVSAIIFLFLSGFINPVSSAIITFIIGMFKEAYDEDHGGCSEWHDVICDCIGIALGALIFIEYIVL